MTQETSVRFSSALWFENASKTHMLIGGCGSIGSWTALLAARAGFNLSLVDDDRVDEPNIGGQLFSPKHVGQTKVQALQQIVDVFCPGSRIQSYECRIEALPATPSDQTVVFVSGFDNMAARETMFRLFKETGKPGDLYLDGRMLFEAHQLYAVRWGVEDDLKAYEASLFSDSEVEEMPCTLKSTSFVAANLATLIVSAALNHLSPNSGRPHRRQLRTFLDIMAFQV